MSRAFDDEALDALEVVIPNLNWRYSGGTAVNRTIAPLIAARWRTAWLGPDRPEGIAALTLSDLVRLRFRPPDAWQGPHLARAAQCRDDRRAVPEPARLWLCADFQFGLAAQEDLAHRLSHRADGCGDRDQRDRGGLSLRAPGDGRSFTASTSISMSPPADRRAAFAETGLPGKYAIGTFGRVRKQKGSDLFVEAMLPAPAEISRFLRRRDRAYDRRQPALCRGAQAADRGRRPRGAHPFLRANCRSRRCRAGISGSRSMCSPRGSRASG